MKKRLFDAWQACNAIMQFAAGVEVEEYEGDLKLRSAVERQIEIVGEALNMAGVEDPALDERLPDLRRIVGMRNRIIHGYDSVDNRIV